MQSGVGEIVLGEKPLAGAPITTYSCG